MMSSDPQESYSTPGFAEFYDEMVARLPPEFEAGADVECVCWPLLRELAAGGSSSSRSGGSGGGGSGSGDGDHPAGQLDASSSPCSPPLVLTVLDMCTGSGRVALGLAARWAAWDGAPPGARLAVVGIDSSAEMLAAARAKAAALPPPAVAGRSSSSDSSGGSGRFDLAWLQGDMAAPRPPLPPGSCALAVLSAGSFHHLLTASDQAAALCSLAACLRRPPAPAYLVLNLLAPEHLVAAAGQVTFAGRYLRTCLAAERGQAPDGGVLWRHRFRLQRYASEAAAAASGTAAVLWECEEGWSLREVAPAELERLAAAAGLRIVRRQAHWADSWGAAAPSCPADDARVFVLALAPA